jgi:hypothetical protein
MKHLLSIVALVLVIGCSAQTPPLFQPPRHIRVGRTPTHVALADVNGDGKLDVLVANADDGTVSVLLGDGKGGLRPAPGSPFPAGPHPSDIAVADFNRDGKLDLAFSNHTVPQFTLVLGDGKGGFRLAPGSPFTILTRPHAHGIAAGDFNGDGNMDVTIESWAEDKVTVVLGDGKGGFRTPGTQYDVGRHPYERLRAADMNGDGRADIVTANFEGANITVLLSDGKGFHPAPGSPFACPPAPFGHALADVNGDGKLDVVVAHYSGQGTDPSKDAVSVLLNLGDGRLGPATRYSAGPLPVGVAIGDVNGDGHTDIAAADLGGSSGSGGATILLGNGRGQFRSGGFFPTGRGTEGVAVGDLNGDGKADVVTADTESDQITLLLAR